MQFTCGRMLHNNHSRLFYLKFIARTKHFNSLEFSLSYLYLFFLLRLYLLSDMPISEHLYLCIDIPLNFLHGTDYSLFGGAESLSEGRHVCGRSPRRVYPASGCDSQYDSHAFPAPPQDPKDFLWLMTEEPHRSRRTAIMKAHPEVFSLTHYFSATDVLVGCKTNGA